MGGERTLAQLSIYPSTAEYRDIHHSPSDLVYLLYSSLDLFILHILYA